jgi:beta-lactamase class A
MFLLSSIQPLLDSLNGRYAFYYKAAGRLPVQRATAERFRSASLIKLPILLAWTWLEEQGEVSRAEICNLDDEEQVQGAGLAWMMQTRHLTFQDALLFMLSLSDNLCANLVIRHIGMHRLNRVIRTELGLSGVICERRLMDFEARQRGLDNWIGAADCVHLFALLHALPPEQKGWIEPCLLANQDDTLLKRDLRRDHVDFFHKTGSLSGVLHDWGYTRSCDVFLLTQDLSDDVLAAQIIGQIGGFCLS